MVPHMACMRAQRTEVAERTGEAAECEFWPAAILTPLNLWAALRCRSSSSDQQRMQAALILQQQQRLLAGPSFEAFKY